MSERKKPQVGDAVVYHDEHGKPHNSLLTCVHSDFMVNLLRVADDAAMQDNYGRQIVRESSVPMKGYPFGEGGVESCVHGRYARYPEEAAVPYKQPQAV